MNTKYILGSTLAAGLLLSSCELDYSATSAIAEETLTENDYQYLLVGVYNGAQQFSMGQLYYVDDIAADGLDDNNYFTDLNKVSYTASYSSFNGWWNALYKGIQLANNYVNLVEAKANKTESDIETQAEARVIRAWLYSKVTYFWGDAPILLEVKNEKVPRNSEVEVWQQIIEDLEFGALNAPGYNNPYHVSKDAAKALLLRALTIGPSAVQNKTRAAQLAEELITRGTFELATNYADIWQKKSNEVILAWNNINGDTAGIGWFLRSNQVTAYENLNGAGSAGVGETGRYQFPVDKAQFDAYEDADQRKAGSVRYLKVGNAETYDVVKYPSYDGADPFPVIRLGEVYLLEAEALGYPAGLDRLNELRAQRGLGAVVGVTAENFLEKIIEERRLELLAEGSRWYDLRRLFNSNAYGKSVVLNKLRVLQPGELAGSRPTASQSFNVSEDGHELLWPIPQTAIDNDPNLAPQNPGY